MACGVGDGSAESTCKTKISEFEPEMESAINQLMKESPDIFDFTDIRGANPRVVSVGRYYLGLINNMSQRGFCAFDNAGSIQVKKTNAFDESFVVLASSGYVRRGPNSYSVTCTPASFPVGVSTPPPSVPGCPLGGSRAIACGTDKPRDLGAIGVAITQVTKEHPELFDFTDVAPGTADGYKVLNADAFIKAVSADLSAVGYCSIFTGDMQLKADNTLSEAYHILTGSSHLRHDIQSFNGTCYPAAF